MRTPYLPFINKKFIYSVGSPVCTDEMLPQTDFNFCDPEIKQSEIRRIFLSKVSADEFTDWSDSSEWALRVSETSTSRNAIRPLMVIGDKPLPNATRINISMSRKYTIKKDHQVNFTIDDVSAINHAFVVAMKGGERFRMWYETNGKMMFGGNAGIPVFITIDMQLNRGQGEIMTYQGVAAWNSPNTEDMIESPIFDDFEGTCGIVSGIEITESTSSSLTATWDTNASAIAYQYAVTVGTSDPTTGIYDTTDTTGTVTGLDADTDYHFWVRAICGVEVASTWRRINAATIPAAPAVPDTTGLVLATMSTYLLDRTGSNVNSMYDFSGNDNHLVIIDQNPTYDATGINGNPAIVFDEVDETALETAIAMVGLNGQNKVNVFIVAKVPAPTTGLQVAYYSDNPGGLAAGSFETYKQATDELTLITRGNIGVSSCFKSFTPNTAAVYTFEVDYTLPSGNEVTIYDNNSSTGSTSSGAADNNGTFDSLKFGIGKGAMSISAVLVYAANKTAPQKATIVNWLKSEFDIV